MKIKLLLITLFFSAISAPSYAQIYQCKDAQNRTVFRDSPCPNRKVDPSTDAGKVWYELKNLLNEGSQIFSLMGPDISSIKACNARIENFQQKLHEAERSLKTLSAKTHAKMYQAVDNLRQCGECRAAAPSYCRKASNYLKEATATLTSS